MVMNDLTTAGTPDTFKPAKMKNKIIYLLIASLLIAIITGLLTG